MTSHPPAAERSPDGPVPASPAPGATGTATAAEPSLPEAAYAAALTALPGCTPARLAGLLAAWSPQEAWEAARQGRVLAAAPLAVLLGDEGGRVAASWRSAARVADVGAGWAALAAAGVAVHLPGRPGFPPALAADHQAPCVLFSLGSPAALDRPRVAIVGTRRCTHYGREVARQLGRELAAAGVVVVSGLALGVDGASHEGALAAGGAPPVAVVGSGLDVVYPRANAALWRRVAAAGAVLSEWPLGARPEPWRFPARNRILAALAQVVVVVESHAGGGSMLTVAAAADRGVPVMAVPGSIRSPASTGTNRLLAEGVAPVQDAADVLVALDLEGARPPGSFAAAPAPLDADEAAVLAAVDVGAPASTEEVLGRTGFELGRAAVLLNRLEGAGVVRGRGGWWERA